MEKDNAINQKLDTLIKLVENLFILIAVEKGLKSEDIRATLGIAKERVNSISKAVNNKKKKEA